MAAFTTEFTQDEVAKLSKNIALGVRELDHNGKKTTFQSIEEMLALRDRMKVEIAAAAAAAAPTPSPIPCMTRRTFFVRD